MAVAANFTDAARLLNGIRPRAPFAALVIADKDRLGRELLSWSLVGEPLVQGR